jgi:hypothetical protein
MNCRLSLVLLLYALTLSASSAGAAPHGESLPDAGEVIRQFVERAAAGVTNPAAGAAIIYRTNITEEFDRKGRLEEREELLLRVTVEAGGQDVELLEVDGRAPTEKERERHLKRFGGRRENSARRERPDRSKQLDAYLTLEILGRYVFTVESREHVDGRPCLRVLFKPGARETKSDKLFERVLDALTGVLWIDETDYQLAKADIQLGEKVSLWGGVLGGLEQLRLQIDRVRDATGLWRDQSVEARFVGRAVTRHIDVRTRDLSSPPLPEEQEPIVAAE